MRNSIWASLIISTLIAGFIYVNFDEDSFMTTMYSSGFIGEKAEITEAEFEEAFTDFLAKYKKSYYNSYEFENRFMVFRDNFQKISDHNLNSEFIGFTLAVNEFADLSSEEFKEKYLGLNAPTTHHRGGHKAKYRGMKANKRPSFESLFEEKEVAEDFENFSWVDQGKVQKVKNQGSCGSCWAFSAIGSVESAFAISHDTGPADLSEQQLVDCSRSYDNQGCNGGWMDNAFEYAESHSLCTEQEYPYKARDDKCQLDNEDFTCTDGVHVTDFVDVEKNSKAALKEAITKNPVSVAVDASGLAWQFYFGGIVRFMCGNQLDHGVLAVGYGHGGSKVLGTTDFWTIKNSWGPGWGEKGFIRIKADENSKGGTCGILKAASYPVVA